MRQTPVTSHREVAVAAIRADDGVIAAAPDDVVWRTLADFERFAAWWPWPLRPRAAHVAATLVGSRYEVRPLAGPDFECEVVAAEPPALMRVRYVRGPYAGTGEWRLAREAGQPGRTSVRYVVDLTTTHPLLQPIGRVVGLDALHSFVAGGVLAALAREAERRWAAGI